MKKQYNNTEKQSDNNKLSITKILNFTEELDIVKLVKYKHPEYQDDTLDDTCNNILFYMEQGHSIDKILDKLNISYSLFELFKLKFNLFNCCINIIKQNRLNIIEDKLINSYDSNSDNLRMFSIKGNMPQYRDNYLPQISGASVININLDGIGSLNIDAGKLKQIPGDNSDSN